MSEKIKEKRNVLLMEPWSFGSDGKELLFSDEMDFPVDAFGRTRKALMEWESKPYYSLENNGLASGKVAVESLELMDLGFTDTMKNHFQCNQAVVVSDSDKIVVSPTCVLTTDSSFGEVDSGWKPSSSVMECNSHDYSLIDLKLGRMADCNGANSKFAKGSSMLASVAKRARTTSSYSQTPFCQVHGCNMDLSSSKDYHKKHKVCDAHSKSARVIVNGMDQRFCQQCSRFHLLVEFEDGNRSCRKRLARHNERRRKPQLDCFSGKPHRLLQSIRGTRFLATSLPKRSPFVFPNIHPGSILYPDVYSEANQCHNNKLENDSIFSSQLAAPMMNGPLLTKPSSYLHNFEKQHCSEIPLDTASNGTSNSSCALSLLSTQSKDLSSYPAGMPVGGPLFYPGKHADHVGGQISERLAANGFYSSMTNPIDIGQMGSIMLSDDGHAACFEASPEGIFHGSGFSNSKHCISPEHETTIDLLQLSSHLRRVERQRSSMPIKHKNGKLSCFLTTQGM